MDNAIIDNLHTVEGLYGAAKNMVWHLMSKARHDAEERELLLALKEAVESIRPYIEREGDGD